MLAIHLLSGNYCIAALRGIISNDELEWMFEEATVIYFKVLF